MRRASLRWASRQASARLTRNEENPLRADQLTESVLSFRRVQTLPACSPVPVALLGHATRPRGPRGEGGPTRSAQIRST